MSTAGTNRNGTGAPVAPAVLDSQYAGGASGAQSGVAYVPSQRLRRGDEQATLELRNTEDGLVAMLAFTSLERLVEGCGEKQPWVAVPLERVDTLRQMAGADVTLWDVTVPPEVRHGHGTEGAR